MRHKVYVSDIVLVQGNKVLLVQQRNPSAYGKWGFPGGRAEPGETPEQTLIRELAEELAIRLDAPPPISVFRTGVGPEEGHLVVTTFVAKAPASPIRLQKDELLDYDWFTLDQVRQLGPKLRSSWIIEMAEKALKDCSERSTQP